MFLPSNAIVAGVLVLLGRLRSPREQQLLRRRRPEQQRRSSAATLLSTSRRPWSSRTSTTQIQPAGPCGALVSAAALDRSTVAPEVPLLVVAVRLGEGNLTPPSSSPSFPQLQHRNHHRQKQKQQGCGD